MNVSHVARMKFLKSEAADHRSLNYYVIVYLLQREYI